MILYELVSERKEQFSEIVKGLVEDGYLPHDRLIVLERKAAYVTENYVTENFVYTQTFIKRL